MKLKNKKTGEIIEWEHPLQYKLDREYDSIKEFAENWEDYKGNAQKYWYISSEGQIVECWGTDEDKQIKGLKSIGNYFENEADAKRVLVGLKSNGMSVVNGMSGSEYMEFERLRAKIIQADYDSIPDRIRLNKRTLESVEGTIRCQKDNDKLVKVQITGIFITTLCSVLSAFFMYLIVQLLATALGGK